MEGGKTPITHSPPDSPRPKRYRLTLIALSLILAIWTYLASSSAVLFHSDTPGTEILIDGKLRLSGTGSFDLFAWKPSYKVQILSKGVRAQMRIYPHASGSDSSSVRISKGKIKFNVACSEENGD